MLCIRCFALIYNDHHATLIQKAVLRYINYWKDKVLVWGEEKAFRPLRISDFEEEDRFALEQGGV
jgi:hypothetical protein